MSASALATLLLARHLHGAPKLTALADSAGRALLVTLLAAGVAVWLPRPQAPGLLGLVLAVLVPGGIFAGLGLVGITWLGDDATRGAVNRLLVRLRLRPAP
jgi:hypothetical protein